MTSLEQVDWSMLPRPRDDGAADHLQGAALPAVRLPTTDGDTVDVSRLPGLTVVFVYPMTGQPGRDLPLGWDAIPGARGCTPQVCSIRDQFGALQEAGVSHLFGLSTQDVSYQREAAMRLHLPFALISDAGFALAESPGLPTFYAERSRYYRRLTLVIERGRIAKVFYPIFPPSSAPDEVFSWLQRHWQ